MTVTDSFIKSSDDFVHESRKMKHAKLLARDKNVFARCSLSLRVRWRIGKSKRAIRPHGDFQNLVCEAQITT
jgi:hypothetical protein